MSLNKVILIGFVGKDPEVKYFDAQNSTATFTLATTEKGYQTKSGEVVPDQTEWHNIVTFREVALFAEKWVKKGSLLQVEGKIRYRSFINKQGLKQTRTEIVADRISFFTLGTNQH